MLVASSIWKQIITWKWTFCFGIAAVVIGSGIYWGDEVDWHIWGVRASVVRKVIGEFIAEQAGETLMTSQQIHKHMRQLDDEIVRLQWLEAESSVAAQNVEKQIQMLIQRRGILQEDLAALSAHADFDSVVLLSDQAVTPHQINTVSSRIAIDLHLVDDRIQLYSQNQAVYADTSFKARSLWQEAEQNRVTIDAYLALYEATQIYDSKARHGSNETKTDRTDTHALLLALQAQVERNQRIEALREQLEQGIPIDDEFVNE